MPSCLNLHAAGFVYNVTAMKLVLCIVHNRDRSKITDELVNQGFKFTTIGSTGGFLREGSTTFLVGTEENQVPKILEIVESYSQAREQLVNVAPIESGGAGAFIPNPVKVPVGGAVVFVLNIESFSRF